MATGAQRECLFLGESLPLRSSRGTSGFGKSFLLLTTQFRRMKNIPDHWAFGHDIAGTSRVGDPKWDVPPRRSEIARMRQVKAREKNRKTQWTLPERPLLKV